MSVPKEVIKSNDPARIASSLKKAALHQLHGGISVVHVPAEVVAIIAKAKRSEKPKTFEEQEYDASTTRAIRLIKYAKKVHDKIADMIGSECLGGFGCVAPPDGTRDKQVSLVMDGLLRPKAEFMLLLRQTEDQSGIKQNRVTAAVAWAKAGTGKFGRKIVLQGKEIVDGNKAKKSDRLNKLYKRHKLVEIDIVAGDASGNDASNLLDYVISSQLAGKCSGVLFQASSGGFQDANVHQTWAKARGFQPIHAYAKKSDGQYQDLLRNVPAQYYALYDTPKSEDEKAKSWPAKFAESYASNTVPLCVQGRKGYKADKLCTF